MIWTPENSKGMMLVDVNGTMILYAIEFNDETGETTVILKNIYNNTFIMSGMSFKEGLEIAKCKVVLVGARMVPNVKTQEL